VDLEEEHVMKRGKLIAAATCAGRYVGDRVGGFEVTASAVQQAPSFRARVDLVRVNAVVRDRKGRFVREILSRGRILKYSTTVSRERIADFRHDSGGVTVALLMDVSGSMEGRLEQAREAAHELLGGMDRTVDEAGISFRHEARGSHPVRERRDGCCRTSLTTIRPIGATIVERRDRSRPPSEWLIASGRRAVVVSHGRKRQLRAA
jgi:hypothetical protein